MLFYSWFLNQNGNNGSVGDVANVPSDPLDRGYYVTR